MIGIPFSVLICLVYLMYATISFWKRRIPSSVPRPPGVPIIGHALRFKTTSAPLAIFTEYQRRFGGIFQLQNGPSDKFVVLASPESVERVLSDPNHLDKPSSYRYFQRWLGKGLLTSTGAKWKKHRRIITPAFHFKVLEDFLEVFNSAGEVLVARLQEEVGKGFIDVRPFFSLYALDAVCETAMGVTINAQQYPDSLYASSVKVLCRVFMERSFSMIQGNDFLYFFTGNFWKERRAVKTVNDFTSSVVKDKKRQLRKRRDGDQDAMNEMGIRRRKAFLDLLLECSQKEKDPLSNEEIRDEVNTFMFAGHDTTSTLLSFAVYCLANNPHVQEIAYQEQISLFGDNMNRNVTFQDLQNMQYLEMVLKETLRLYPSVPIFSRILAESTEICGATIPKSLEVIIFVYGIHHDPYIYPDPEKFIPERFCGASNRSPYAYIPFSAGSRNCIGQKFAMVEAKATLSKLLRNFQFLPATTEQTLNLAFEVVLTSKNGICVALKDRN